MNQEIEMENNLESMDKVYRLIETEIGKTGQHFSHLIIDGEDIYENMEEYINNNIRIIKEIKVMTATMKEFILDIIITTREYIEKAIPQIISLSDCFYSNPSAENWNAISNLFDGIGWIIDSFKNIDGLKNLNVMFNDYENWNQYTTEIHSLTNILIDLKESLENDDIMLVGDLLSYEIVPIMKNMEFKLSKLILN